MVAAIVKKEQVANPLISQMLFAICSKLLAPTERTLNSEQEIYPQTVCILMLEINEINVPRNGSSRKNRYTYYILIQLNFRRRAKELETAALGFRG